MDMSPQQIEAEKGTGRLWRRNCLISLGRELDFLWGGGKA